MTKKIEPIPAWTGYSGNKEAQIETLMRLIPKHSKTFVDLFGGTGVVGCNAYHFNRCERVVYNDLEYDLMLMLKNFHRFTGDQVVGGYGKLFYPSLNGTNPRYKRNERKWKDEEQDFPSFDKNLDTGTVTIRRQASAGKKPKEPKLLVPRDTVERLYRDTIKRYNESRLIVWDLERQEEDVEKSLGRALKAGYFQSSAEGKIQYRFTKEEVEEIIERGGDFQDPFALLFLTKFSFQQTPRFAQRGRRFNNTPRLPKQGYVNIRKGEKDIREFFNAWHETPVDFFSVSFTEGWLSIAPHLRPRHEEMRRRWMHLLESLTPKDFVFIDPPYHGSNAPYNSGWKLSMEIYLMAFCQQLDERGIPFLITNNIGWNRTILIEWTRLPHIHTYMWDPDKPLNLYKGDKEKNKYEVYISNKLLPAAKYGLPDGLMEVALQERTPEELPAEIRYEKKPRGETYRARKAKGTKPQKRIKKR